MAKNNLRNIMPNDGSPDTPKPNNDAASKKTLEAAQKLAAASTSLGLGIPTFTAFAKSTGKFGEKIAAVSGVIEQQVGQYQKLTKSGVHFGGSITAMLTASTRAGLSIDKMTGLVSANSELLAGFGDTVQGGATTFLNSLGNMAKSNNQYGMQLRNIGLTHEEIGEAMIETQRMAMMSGRKDAASASDIQERTAAYAKDLDLLSKLTGKSNDELKKQQAGLAREGNFRAKTMGMEAGMQQALKNAASEADASGIGDLFKDMMIQGFPSSDQAALAGAFGNSMAVMDQMKAAQDAGNQKEYQRLQGTLSAAAAKDKLANRELAMLGGTNSVTAALADSYAKTSESQIGIMAQASRENWTDYQTQQAFAKQRAKAMEEQDSQGGKAKPGEEVKGDRQVLDAALRGQEAMVQAAVKVQKVTEQFYNDTLGPLMQKIKTDFNAVEMVKDLSNGVGSLITLGNEKIAGMSTATPVNDTNELLKQIQTAILKAPNSEKGAELTKVQADIKSLRDGPQTEDNTKKLIEALNKGAKLTGSSKEFSLPTPKAREKSGGVGTESNAPDRRTGSPGVDSAAAGLQTLASTAENWGKESLVKLHNWESVVPIKEAGQYDATIKSLSKNQSLIMSKFDKIFGGQSQKVSVSQATNKTPTSKAPSASPKASMAQVDDFSSSTQRNVAALGKPSMAQVDDFSSPLRNGAVSSKAAINTVRADKGQGNITEEMNKQISKAMEAISAQTSGDGALARLGFDPEIFTSMRDAMERTASGVGSQLIEQKNMTKVTKNLGGIGNAFSRAGLS